MQILNVLSAGAAQAVVARLASRLRSQGVCGIDAHYGAVQSVKAKMLSGHPCDVVVLSDALIDGLEETRQVVAGSRVDLGSVRTALASRAGIALPSVDTAAAFKEVLLACRRIVCPDPATATAGKVLLQALQRLEVAAQLQPRLQYCVSGAAAIAELARGTGADEVAVVQLTEIIAAESAGLGIALAGPLPAGLQMPTVYSAGLAAGSRQPALAREFVRLLAADRAALQAAGFDACARTAAA